MWLLISSTLVDQISLLKSFGNEEETSHLFYGQTVSSPRFVENALENNISGASDYSSVSLWTLICDSACPCDQGVDFTFPQELLTTYGVANLEDLVDHINNLEDEISEYLPDDENDDPQSFSCLIQRLQEILEEE